MDDAGWTWGDTKLDYTARSFWTDANDVRKDMTYDQDLGHYVANVDFIVNTADGTLSIKVDGVLREVYTFVKTGAMWFTLMYEHCYFETPVTVSSYHQIGKSDQTTGYAAVRSETWTVKPGYKLTRTFDCYGQNIADQNYHNFAVLFNNGTEYGARPDNWINGEPQFTLEGLEQTSTRINNDWWNAFREAIKNARVSVTVANGSNGVAEISMVITGRNEDAETYVVRYKNITAGEKLSLALTVDGSYITYTDDQPAEEPYVPTAKASLTLTDEVGLNFILSGPIDGYTVELDGEKSTVVMKKGEFVVTKSVAAKDFDQLVQLKLFDKNENQVDVYCSGVPLSVVQNSVKLMCEAYENGDGIGSDVKAVAKAMRVYSSYAHNYFFPNDQVDLGQDAVTNANDDAIKAFTITQPTEGDVKAKSMSLTLRGKTIMTVNLSDGTAKEITDIEPKDLGSAMDVDAGNHNVVSVAPMYYGSLVLNYMTEDTALCNVVRALYAYAMACAEYHSK